MIKKTNESVMLLDRQLFKNQITIQEYYKLILKLL